MISDYLDFNPKKLIFNKFYEVEEEASRYRIKANYPTEIFEKEHGVTYFPDVFYVEKNVLKDEPTLRKLQRMFIIVNKEIV